MLGAAGKCWQAEQQLRCSAAGRLRTRHAASDDADPLLLRGSRSAGSGAHLDRWWGKGTVTEARVTEKGQKRTLSLAQSLPGEVGLQIRLSICQWRSLSGQFGLFRRSMGAAGSRAHFGLKPPLAFLRQSGTNHRRPCIVEATDAEMPLFPAARPVFYSQTNRADPARGRMQVRSSY